VETKVKKMNLIHKTVTVDIDDWGYLRRHNINLSAEIRDYLRQRVAIMRGNLEDIDVELIRRKMEVKKEKFVILQAEIRNMEDLLKKNKDLAEQKKLEDLEAEKEKIESQTKCINCGNFIENKSHKFKGGNVCHACFLSATGKQVTGWNKVEDENKPNSNM